MVLLAACGGRAANHGALSAPGPAGPVPGTRIPSAQRSQAGALRPAAGVFTRALLYPQVVFTGNGLYLAWQVSPLGKPSPRWELARVNPVTGAVEASMQLTGVFEQAVEASGALWAAYSDGLARLTPGTLKVTGRWQISGLGQHWGALVLAAAGGGLWAAGGNRLLRLSLPDGRVDRSIALPGAASSDLSANAAGTVLAVGEAGSSGRGSVQRRDPATGAILASHPMTGVAAPAVAGPDRSAIWLSESAGMMGFVQRLDATTLRPASTCREGARTNGCVAGTNAILARLAAGLLWVTDPPGGRARNYCADPSDGRVLAVIRLPATGDAILAISRYRIFYAAPGPGAREYVRQMAIPPGCRI